MHRYLHKPHPFIFNAYSVFIPAVVTFLIILFLSPKEFQDLDFIIRLIAGIVISSFVALSIVIAVFLLKKRISSHILEEEWTIGKELILVFFVLLLIILFLSLAVSFVQKDYDSFFSLFLKTSSITISIGILPILILLLFEQNSYQIKQVEKANQLNTYLKRENNELRSVITDKSVPPNKLLIKSENEGLELQLNPMDLIMLKSDGNYVEVFYLNADQLKKKLIRNSLKKLEGILPQDIFFRCHNRFLVNGNHIVKFEGNARNLELHLHAYPDKIPVSRAKVKAISSFLNRADPK